MTDSPSLSLLFYFAFSVSLLKKGSKKLQRDSKRRKVPQNSYIKQEEAKRRGNEKLFLFSLVPSVDLMIGVVESPSGEQHFLLHDSLFKILL
mmetsp:Transcript_49336/g.56668  ORF Transcript_49336/g.56668 Transcript_49336/m.56668 type:complete len:92 (-) Transcript_49336:265-540(-)